MTSFTTLYLLFYNYTFFRFNTVWNPSPHSHHVAEHGAESTTLKQNQMKKDAHKRALKHEKRIVKQRKIKQRQLLLKRKLISHAKTGM